MTPRQEEPIVARVFHQRRAGLDEALLQAGQRPALDTLGQHQTLPQIPRMVGEHELQNESRSLGTDGMTAAASVQPACLPLLGGPEPGIVKILPVPLIRSLLGSSVPEGHRGRDRRAESPRCHGAHRIDSQ